jgi:hypothetical protein
MAQGLNSKNATLASAEFPPACKARESGYILLLVPFILVAMFFFGAKMISRSQTGMKIAGLNMDYLQTELCTQQCASLAVNQAVTAMNNNSSLPTGTSTCTCNTHASLADQACTQTLSTPKSDQNTGCYGIVYSVLTLASSSTCSDTKGQKATLNIDAELNEIPLFQFAVFYDKYLEFQNGPPLQMNGRIHSNDTIELKPGSKLTLDNWITAFKSMGASALGSGSPGNVHYGLKNMTGFDPIGVSNPTDDAFQPLKKLSFSTGWAEWKKNHLVAYEDEGNDCLPPQKLKLPLKGITDYHALIDWRDSINDNDYLRKKKYAWKANLICRAGIWMNNDLSPAGLAPNPLKLPPKFKVSATNPNRVTFWEPRDEMMLQLLPIDLAFLQQRKGDSIIYLHDTLPDPAFGNKNAAGFLLYNGEKLERPLTIVSSTRMVLYGDYNTQEDFKPAKGPKSVFPSALISDCMIHLSTFFNPDEHTLTNHPGMREMGNTYATASPPMRLVLNACVMTGVKPIKGSLKGQGGFNNLVRMDENWGGNEYEKNGSMVCMWHSRDTYGNHAAYSAPSRFFTFDTLYNSLENMPPGTPRLVNPVLANWEMVRE